MAVPDNRNDLEQQKFVQSGAVAAVKGVAVVNPDGTNISAALSDGTQTTKITNGTTVADTLAGDTGQNVLLIAGNRKEVTFTTTTAQAVGTTDVSNYRWVSVYVAQQGGSSVVNFQGSNDNSNWVSVSLFQANSTTGTAAISTTGTTNIFHGGLGYRYFRLNVTGIASGTTSGTIQFFSSATGIMGMGVQANQAGTWNIGSSAATGSAVPSSAFLVGVQGASSLLQTMRSAGNAGTAAVGTDFVLATGQYRYNNTTFDAERGNFDTAALITAAGATTNQTSSDQVNYNGRGVRVVLDMTNAGTGSVTLTVQGKDAASGKYYTLLQGAAVTTNSTNVYTVFPGVTASANVSASDVLPRVWRVTTTANNANATTYTVGASVIV